MERRPLVASPNPELRERLFALEVFGIKLGLEQIQQLVAALDYPDRAFPSLIIAGTNGKGSVSAILERGFRAAGYRTGRYTSPHLVDLEERFAIDGVTVDPSALDVGIGRLFRAAERLPAPPSFFEATTAIALDLFRETSVDVAVLEVGLGGRLDATNVVMPVAAVITSIDFDHEQYLGDTIEAIAGEKAGVIKAGSLVIEGRNPLRVDAVIGAKADAVGARLVRSTDGTEVETEMLDGRARLALTTPRRRYGPLTLALRGRHQVDNAVTAIRALEEIDAAGTFNIPESAVRIAVEDVVWPARLEVIATPSGDVLIDGAHNPAGAHALSSYVQETYGRRLPFVVGAMRDKKLDALIAALARSASRFVFASASTPRAARPADLLAIASTVAPDVPARAIENPLEALRHAQTFGAPVVVAGSLYLAGEVRAALS